MAAIEAHPRAGTAPGKTACSRCFWCAQRFLGGWREPGLRALKRRGQSVEPHGCGAVTARSLHGRPTGAKQHKSTHTRSHTLKRQRNPLPYADAHRAQREAALGALQLIHRGAYQTRTAHPKRMAQRDGTAMRIDTGIVVSDA